MREKVVEVEEGKVCARLHLLLLVSSGQALVGAHHGVEGIETWPR